MADGLVTRGLIDYYKAKAKAGQAVFMKSLFSLSAFMANYEI